MSDNIIQLNEDLTKRDLKDIVHGSVEETLNVLLDKETEEPINAPQKVRIPVSVTICYHRMLPLQGVFYGKSTDRDVSDRCLRPPCGRYHRSPVGEMKASSGMSSTLNQKAYEHIATCPSRLLAGDYPYVYMDSVYLKHHWGGDVQNVPVLVPIGGNRDGFHEIKHRTRAIGLFPDGHSALMLDVNYMIRRNFCLMSLLPTHELSYSL